MAVREQIDLNAGPRPVHPLLFAIFPVLSLYSHNADDVPPGHLLRPLACVVAAAAILWWALRRPVPDRERRALLVSVALGFGLSYGHLRGLPEWLAGPDDVRALLLPAVWALLLAVAVRIILRAKGPLSGVTRVMNVVGAAALAGPLCLTLPVLAHALQATGGSRPSAVRTAASEAPDIYYLILDGYGRDDVLLEKYGHDNRPFLKELERRGFYVARKSCANYIQTQVSLGSSLNFTYLDHRRPGDARKFTQLIDRNDAAAFLRERGYRFCAVGTGFDATAVPSADIGGSSSSAALTHFEGLLLNMTPLSVYSGLTGSMYDRHRHQVNEALEYLGGLPDPARKAPLFVFAHIVSPHPPFVFAADGSPVAPKRAFSMRDATWFFELGGTPEEYRRGYTAQMTYLNRRILEVIDQIQARSARPPVIVIQGDHGPGMHLDLADLRKSDVRERFPILMACRLPDAGSGGKEADLYPEISPVNLFRVVFNRYHAAGLPLLPDRSYFSTWMTPYNFVDVTASARSAPPGKVRALSARPSPTQYARRSSRR